ncbi:AMP-binding protein [Methylococcus sp. EFPC2]|uniref:AMP-binding protein n=1 Tax=Methylococcus sp. EFPC2 TaxID=2812648 RepID=UPI001967852C|nr:AMP-binding protein [Methylococcus sp. EFPC2]QSA98252.1 AMP-binding protein [Methylococcus sp. EFPC2]
MTRIFIRWLLSLIYRVEISGLEHFAAAGKRTLIVANHASFLDPILLWAFLPEEVTFAINTHIARQFWVRPALKWVRTFAMDPTQPLSVKALTHYLRQDRKAVIFPEGRITVTGALMKIYDGAGLVADKAEATVLPARIDGAQYTPFSRLRGVLRLRWFPKISINLLPPRRLDAPADLRGDRRRKHLGTQLEDLMTEMVFATTSHRSTLFQALLDARKIHGGGRRVLEDMQRTPWSYNHLIARTLALGDMLAGITAPGEAVGLLLPSVNNTVAALLGLQVRGRVPALLNYSAGIRALQSACKAACVGTVLTSRRFVEIAKLEADLAELAMQVRLVYLEDLASELGLWDKIGAWLRAMLLDLSRSGHGDPDGAAVILFTSGTEGTPKGVVLSHANLLANRAQIAARLDFNAQDRVLNVLPLFHSFGLTAGTLLPLMSGLQTFLYPSPLHYRIIPELAYDLNATILFGTNTFLAGYAKHAHPYDFYSLRYVFAGAEKLQEDTRRIWSEKFGLRVLEGYGATETSPILAANTPMHCRAGTVGRLMPGIRYRLEPVPGVSPGGRLHVAGANVMLGYLLVDHPGELVPPASSEGAGWYDTGDVVAVDEDGYVAIKGRIKRFAKVGGEMISLAAVEELAGQVWPGALHAAIALPDARKGEIVVLATEHRDADRVQLAGQARLSGLSELHLPREVVYVEKLPLLATGKLDYPGVVSLLG